MRAGGQCWNAVCRAPGGALYRRAARGNSGQRDVPTHAAAAAADTDDDAAGQLPGHRHFTDRIILLRACVRGASYVPGDAHTRTDTLVRS